MRRISILLVLFLAATTNSVFGYDELGTNDLRISLLSPDGSALWDHLNPRAAYNSTNDEFFVVWAGSTDSLANSEFEIYGQRINASTGALLSTPVRLSDMGGDNDATYQATEPSVSYNSTNNEYLVVWIGDDNTSPLVNNEFEIFGQRVNAATGAELGTNDFRISDLGTNGDTSFFADSVDVAYNSVANEYLVVFDGSDNTGSLIAGEFEIFGQRINAATGAEVGTNDFRISAMGPDGSMTYTAEEVAVDYNSEDNEYLVVWYGDDNTAPLIDEEYEIFGQRLTAAGAETGTDDFQISSAGGLGNTSFFAARPDVAYNAQANEYLVVWYGDDNTGTLVDNEFEAFGQRLTSAGIETGDDDFRISTMGPDGNTTYGVIARPQVAWNQNSNQYFVTWSGDTNDGALVDEENEVYGQLLSTAGALVAPNEARLSRMGTNGDALFDGYVGSVAASTQKDFFYTTWSGDHDSGGLVDEEFEIFGQLFGSSADLSVETFDSADPAGLDGRFTYLHVVSNAGSDTAVSLTLTDTLPEGVTYVNASGSGWSCSHASGIVTCTKSSLTSGSSTIVLVDVMPTEAGDVTNTTTISSASNDADATDDTATEVTTVESDTDGDGIGNSADNDDDDDGLTDLEEESLSTDPLDSDSDNDGVSDGQEVTDETNPLDGGSSIPTLASGFCSEWNGYLGGLWNINEYVNLSGSRRTVQATIYDIAGLPKSISEVDVLSGAQTDLLVHGMFGWTTNSYGKVCTTITNGSAGDIDGRMVYYKPSGSSFQFAFALPFQNGVMGSQFVSFNTFQPSLDSSDSDNLVTNWIQLTNLGSSQRSGRLYYYGQDGIKLGEEAVTLSGGARRDFSGHQFGPSLVGMIEWRPTSATAEFSMRNVRYYYDNVGSTDSFDSAFQLEGLKGTGEKIAVPLDTNGQTAVLEVLNTTTSTVSVDVIIYDADGTAVDTESFDLPKHGSRHIIADSFLNGGLGVATINGSTTGSIVAVGMHYGRNASLGINFVYGILAKQARGSVLRGSYNTFLSQGCSLVLVNPTGSSTEATVSMTRYDGTSVLSGEALSLPAHGAVSYDLCANELADNYGVVTVQPTTADTVVAHVIRLGSGDVYRFPTPVRQ